MQVAPGNEKGSKPAIEYVFDNRNESAEKRYLELSVLYDAQTLRHIEQRGIEEGWSCLEVGGGGGSIASWLCKRVGPTGRVLATDLEPRFLETLAFPNLEVRRHDIRHEGLPERQFNLAHARLVLMHLPGRELAVQRMLASLKPGGWIVVEEFDNLSILPNSTANPGEEELKVIRAGLRVLAARGVELRYGRWLPRQLRSLGLVNVGAEASTTMWHGDSPGTRLYKLAFEELADPILRSGLISDAEFETDMRRLDELDFLMPSPMMWTAWGQVPEVVCGRGVEGLAFQHQWLPVEYRR
jgi:ubiquinone/menaquinone biosynthesis C-methylase UbiE